MLRKISHSFLSLLGACVLAVVSHIGTLQAAEIRHLYDAEVPVKDQTASERKQAIQQALIRVMIKVSGNAQVALTNGMPSVLQKANNYVREYRYQAAPAPATTSSSTETPDQPLSELWVRFSPDAVNSQLRKLALPVWGRARPATLVWLAYDDQGERGLLNGNEHPEIKQQLDDEAARRGLPLVWPLLDLEDQAKISFADVWAGFQDRVVAASGRYQSEAILVGRLLHRRDGTWDARWHLFTSATGPAQAWESSGDLTEVIPVGINNTADQLAGRYAQTGESGTSLVHIRINNVNSAGAYERSLKFLRGLEPVEDIQLVSLNTDSVDFNLQLRGTQNDLMQSLKLSDNKLLLPVASQPVPITTPPVATSPQTTQITPEILTFRFLK